MMENQVDAIDDLLYRLKYEIESLKEKHHRDQMNWTEERQAMVEEKNRYVKLDRFIYNLISLI